MVLHRKLHVLTKHGTNCVVMYTKIVWSKKDSILKGFALCVNTLTVQKKSYTSNHRAELFQLHTFIHNSLDASGGGVTNGEVP